MMTRLGKKTAKRWAEANDAPIKPEHINCMGCRTEGVKYLYCNDLLSGPQVRE